jgi:hypothetical protein
MKKVTLAYHEAKKLLELAVRLRDELHGFRELFDENDPASGRLIAEFDKFIVDVEMPIEEQSAMETESNC